MSLQVYFYEAFEEEESALRETLGDEISAGFTWKTVQEAGDERPAASLISIRTQSQIPSGWGGRLGGVLSRSTGYDHLVRFVRRCGEPVECGYLPLYCKRAVAEQAMLLWTGLLRKLPGQVRSFERFKRDGLSGRECFGKRMVVVGVGNIGGEVVKLGEALGMDVVGVDIVERYEDVRYAAIEQAIEGAEVVVCAMNLTEQNRRYFSAGLLGRARTGAVFVNVARGELAVTEDLVQLLDEGQLGGVGLDVYEDEGELAVAMRSGGQGRLPEKARAVMELSERTNVILTPHNAFNTVEAVHRKAQQSAEQVHSFLKTGRFVWPVPGEKEK